MTKEEYQQLKAEAQEQMREDYRWMMSQPPATCQWRCPQRWLIEFVYDSNKEWAMDDFFRRTPMQRLYDEFFRHTGSAPPNHPSIQLSKLRAMEQRRNIRPDSITRYYMLQMEKKPKCRIIELLMESK